MEAVKTKESNEVQQVQQNVSKQKNTMKLKTEFSKNNTLALKGIAIIMLMFRHLFKDNNAFKNYTVSFFPFGQALGVELSAFGKICVSIFAFLTGYGLMLSLKKLNEKYDFTNKQICKWTIGRIIKTLSGYWVIVVLSMIICQIIDGRTQTVLFNKGIINGIILTIVNFFGLTDLFGVTSFCSTWWYMRIALLFIISIPIFAKLFKKHGYLLVLASVVALPRILGWKYSNSSYIAFIFPVLLGMIFAEHNLMVKIANIKINKNNIVNKVFKLIIDTILIVVLYIIYNNLQENLFWEIRYGIIPVCLMCYLYEFYIDIPVLKHILQYLGKHSMNIFLIHSFIRAYYCRDFIYSQGNFIKIAAILLLCSLALSIAVDLFKKLIRYDKWINSLQCFVNKKIDKYIYE